MMPPYFDRTPYLGDNFGKWIRDGDVVVAVGAKSGTNWLLNCAHQIRAKGSDDLPWVDPLATTPWVEFRQYPGEKFEDNLAAMNTTVLADGSKLSDQWNNDKYAYRAFKTHFTPMMGAEPGMDEILPIKDFPKVKFLAMARNGKDVMASFRPFWESHTPEFKKTWGGFPPNYPTSAAMLKDLLPGGPIGHLWFNYVRSWWAAKDEDNVLLLHYNDLKKDLKGGIKKIAKFVDVELNGKEFAAVEEKCGFVWMKENGDKFNYNVWNSPTPMNVMVDGTLINKGVSGRGKGFIDDDDEMLKMWDDAVDGFFDLENSDDAAMFKWAMEGSV
eukprot:CAMPEP_0182527288 /NCGR_PEP_ID=MMETSP1323-20130603/3746_1 /TAXON_ID=236787 /ORGANISM="Florenciella parvula, Strain RCC1693" /LENGTH=327 /DNA_ID=CAMNT_0024736255 /DNA_START=59 /DNA_END=1042 /DNA_ORIENTATION=-